MSAEEWKPPTEQFSWSVDAPKILGYLLLADAAFFTDWRLGIGVVGLIFIGFFERNGA